MSEKQTHMFVKKKFASQITSNELETIDAIDKADQFNELSEGKFDMIDLKSLFTKHLTRFNRTFKDDKRIGLFKLNHQIRMKPITSKIPDVTKKRKQEKSDKKEKPARHKVQRRTPSDSNAFLANRDLPPHKHCKTPICIKNNKQHTHETHVCGYVRRDGPQGAPPAPSRNSQTGQKYNRDRSKDSRTRTPANSKPIKCFFCDGDHMKRDCLKFAKLQKSEQFMATVEHYDGQELECLDLLICTTNKAVCKYCLLHDCNGQCGDTTSVMRSAQDNFFSDGSYEQVLAIKSENLNSFGHSPFSRDSYLSTRPMQESEGAESEDDPQENISIRPKSPPTQENSDVLQIGLDNSGDSDSDKSSVDEDAS